MTDAVAVCMPALDTPEMEVLPHRRVCEQAQSDAKPGETYDVLNPLSNREWVDAAGVVWRRRGDGDLALKQAVKLLARPEVTLMHVYDGPAHRHEGSDRAGLVAEIRSVDGESDPNHEFQFGEFKNDPGHHMVMVVEFC